MEADTGIAVPLFTANGGVNAFFPYGRVLYEHGGGIDAPLGVVRMEYSDKLHDAQLILPHATWRGSYARGTTIGSCFVYGTNGQFLLPPPDSTPSGGDGTRVVGGQYDGSAQHCINVDWPAAYTWSARQYRRGYDGPVSWMGSLIYESRDASGLYYRRNRYYDSEKGRFTQEDPIGLAGGVNVYGFANGDPVSYGDPYGLCPWYLPRGSGACILADAYQEHGIRGIVNEVIGVTPLAGDLNDAVVAVSGTNPITGEHVGRGGRGLAALAVAVPIASSSALRALGREARGGVFAAEALVPGRPFRGRRAPEEAYKHLQRYHGLDPNVASNRLHILKESYGLRPDDDVIIGRTGDVYNGHTGERLGSLTDPNLGGRKR